MHSLLEMYLAEVAAQLAPLPTRQRNEELREIRTHLENAVIVNRELGQSEAEAAQSAVAQFGPSQELGENVVWAWRRGQMRDRRSFWSAAACVILVTSFLTHLTPLLQSYLPPTPLRGFVEPPFSGWLWAQWIIWLMPTFLLAGGMSGFLFPKCAVAGVTVGLTARHLYFLAGGIVSGLWYWSLTVAIMDVIFIAFASSAAWAGSRWRNTRAGRVRLARG